MVRFLFRLQGREREEPVVHDQLPHAHWDRVQRRWVTHVDEPSLARAA